jgi:hypothetical protein
VRKSKLIHDFRATVVIPFELIGLVSRHFSVHPLCTIRAPRVFALLARADEHVIDDTPVVADRKGEFFRGAVETRRRCSTA